MLVYSNYPPAHKGAVSWFQLTFVNLKKWSKLQIVHHKMINNRLVNNYAYKTTMALNAVRHQ